MTTESEQKMAMQDQRLKENMGRIQHKILVMSGKGGVGKTTVAVNFAYQLALMGKRVGILDVDIHGPNIAKMLGIEEKKIFEFDNYIEPVAVMPNLKAVSISMFSENCDQPFIWRGPRKMAAIKQFLSDVNWGELDYLIIDSPPGTGDEPLSICQLIPDIDGAVIVTTPQDVAVLDSRKSIMFARALEIPVLGIIENMSGFVCPHCQKAVALFGQGGGEKAAYEMRVPFLGHIPIDPQVVIQGDTGRPFVQSDTTGVAEKAMESIIEQMIKNFKN
jgi:Mrp family chromosome partitioning ATPase